MFAAVRALNPRLNWYSFGSRNAKRDLSRSCIQRRASSTRKYAIGFYCCSREALCFTWTGPAIGTAHSRTAEKIPLQDRNLNNITEKSL